MNARHWAGGDAIGDAFTGIGNNRMGHSVLSFLGLTKG
jgi:hypothetical protein